MAKKKKENKKVAVEKEITTAPKLQEAVAAINNIAEKMLGERLKNVACNIVGTMTPSKRSSFIYRYIADNNVLTYISATENNKVAYVISGDTIDIAIDKEYIAGDFEIEPIHMSDYVYSGYFTYSERNSPNYMDIQRVYKNLDIRLVLDFIFEFPIMLCTLIEHKYRASKTTSMQVLRCITIYMRLLEVYRNFFVSYPIISNITKGELYFNKYKVNMVKQVAPSNFIVKLKETNFVAEETVSCKPHEFTSFRLLEKMFETFNIKQFDIDISELCSNISPLMYFKLTIIKDISLAYNGFDIYSELASIGVGAYDEWWDVKSPVAIIQFGNEDLILLTKINEKVVLKFIRGKDKLSIEDDGSEESELTVEDTVIVAFRFILDKFNERIHEFFRLNDKGMGTFDVEVITKDHAESHSNRHFTPKKTVVKGHIRHYKSGAIAYVLPHVRCYEGGEDSIVTLNLK